MRILIACEYSAIVRDAFINKGHDAWSCDLIDTEGDKRFHIKGDVLDVIKDGWDMMIGHPPCTYLSNSGVRWLHERAARWPLMFDGADFFKKLLDADIPKVVIENPIMHKYAIRLIGKKHDQLIQPWMFGDEETKATCLWLKGVDPLKKTINIRPENVKARVWCMSPGKDRNKERSRFFPLVAKAMADQWG